MRLLFSEEDPLCTFLETEDEASDWAETFVDVPDEVAARWLAVQKAWCDLQEEVCKSSFPKVTREAPARIREREETRIREERHLANESQAKKIKDYWKGSVQ